MIKTNKEVITQVLKRMNLEWGECVEFVPDRLGHDFRYSITNHKMMQYVDFEQTSFEAGLEQTIKEYL